MVTITRPMLSDRRQQELVKQWATLSVEELMKWIEQQADQDELLNLVIRLEMQKRDWQEPH